MTSNDFPGLDGIWIPKPGWPRSIVPHHPKTMAQRSKRWRWQRKDVDGLHLLMTVGARTHMAIDKWIPWELANNTTAMPGVLIWQKLSQLEDDGLIEFSDWMLSIRLTEYGRDVIRAKNDNQEPPNPPGWTGRQMKGMIGGLRRDLDTKSFPTHGMLTSEEIDLLRPSVYDLVNYSSKAFGLPRVDYPMLVTDPVFSTLDRFDMAKPGSDRTVIIPPYVVEFQRARLHHREKEIDDYIERLAKAGVIVGREMSVRLLDYFENRTKREFPVVPWHQDLEQIFPPIEILHRGTSSRGGKSMAMLEELVRRVEKKIPPEPRNSHRPRQDRRKRPKYQHWMKR